MQRFLPWIERKSSRSAFTLIELLVVIAIIAILAVVVVLTLNPAELLRQSRDANRVSDMSTLNDAISLYQTDQSSASGYSLGTTSSTYISLPDSSSTCGTWGFTSGYACASSTSSRNVNGSGWIPINFSLITSGSPLGSLPVDPTNTSSSRLYYMYAPSGSEYQVIAFMESQKYQQTVPGIGGGIDVVGDMQTGGPVGWWKLNEGTGSTTIDSSGNGNNGTWAGTATGTRGYYSPGITGGWAGDFDGTSTYVSIPYNQVNSPLSQITVAAWINTTNHAQNFGMFVTNSNTAGGGDNKGWNLRLNGITTNPMFTILVGSTYVDQTIYSTSIPVLNNTWTYVVGTFDGLNVKTYVNGMLAGSYAISGAISYGGNNPVIIGTLNGGSYFFPGLISDVRIYNRALSPTEIAALYDSER